MFSKSLLIKIGINTLIGIAAIWLWLQFIDLKDVIHTIERANFYLLLPVAFFLWLSLAIRAYKLKFFLKEIKNISLKDVIALNGVGTMLNILIPIRAGEIAKGLYLGQAYNIPVSKSLVWIFLDRFLDFLILLAILPVLLIIVPTNLDKIFITIIVALTVVLVFLTYIMIYQKSFAATLFEIFTHFLVFRPFKVYFTRVYLHFLDTFAVLKRSVYDWIVLIVLGLLGYASDALVLMFSFLSINSDQSFVKMYLGQLLSAVTYIIPAAPGYVGSAEASALIVFSGILGISPDIASSMIVLLHAVTLVSIIIFGVISIYILDLNLGSLMKKVLRKEETE